MSEKILKVLKFIWVVIPMAQRTWILDKILDYGEDLIEESENKIDDLFLPIIKIFRESFNIKDND